MDYMVVNPGKPRQHLTYNLAGCIGVRGMQEGGGRVLGFL